MIIKIDMTPCLWCHYMITIDCGLHADCAKFVPGRDDLFIIACYELVESVRKGKLILANIEGKM